MEKKFYYAQVPPLRFGKDLAHGWKYQIPAYRAAPHVWNVGGQDDVAVYLLDTGEGLILLDSGYFESVYLVVDRMHRLGFDPRDVKHILLSHWHGDHVNGAAPLQALSGAKLWLSREDEAVHRMHPEGLPGMVNPEYVTDCFYDDQKPITLGRFTIHTRLCPGHTPGVTSFFFTDRDDQTGEVFQCAMHGGIGVYPMMTREWLQKDGATEEQVFRFVSDCQEMAKWKVDICLASHMNQGNVLPNLPKDLNDYRVFIADYAWGDILLDRAEAAKKLYPEKYGA